MMDISLLAAKGDKIDLTIAEIRGEVKVTKLPPVKPRRTQLVYTKG